MWHWREECRLWLAFCYLESPQLLPGRQTMCAMHGHGYSSHFHKVTGIIDGNTIEVSPMFFGGLYGIPVRLANVDAPEPYTREGIIAKPKAIRSCWRSSDRVTE